VKRLYESDEEIRKIYQSSSNSSLINAIDQPNLVIRGCTVRYVHFIGYGSFIQLYSDTELWLENTLIHGKHSHAKVSDSSAGYGGAIIVFQANAWITNCTFRNNFAYLAGAILAQDLSGIHIDNTKFIGNYAIICGVIRISANS
jgi:hypothetical protein